MKFLTFLMLVVVVTPSALAAPETITLEARKSQPFPGQKAGAADVTFGVIPKRMLGVSTWYNPISRAVEQRIQPPIEHPIPVLRCAHVRAFEDRPDLAKIGQDDLDAAENEAEIKVTTRFALVGDGRGGAALLSLSDVRIPQDKTDDWRVTISAERVTLVDHVADAVRDVGRAVPTKEPLPLTGHFIFGTREQRMSANMVLKRFDQASGAVTELAKPVDGRAALNGTVVDRVEGRMLQITDAGGRKLGTVTLEGSDIREFNVNADGTRVAVSTERYVEDPDPNKLGHREIATMVFAADGKKLADVVGYDDPAFLPDGNLLLTGPGGSEGLFVADLKSGKVIPIKVAAPKDAEIDWPQQPAVSPDGRRVAFCSHREVYVMDLDGSHCVPVWNNRPAQEPQCHPTFSPDGRYVAFVNVPTTVMTGPGTIVVFDVEKHVRQELPATKGADSEVPITWGK